MASSLTTTASDTAAAATTTAAAAAAPSSATLAPTTSVGISLSSSTTTTSSLSSSPIPTRALTTTFTPADDCNSGYLTQLSAQGYRIWGVEPVPVPNSTFSECFPSEFLNGYTSTLSSSVAPFLSPLVCPKGWHTAGRWEGGYVACCASGYLLAYPSSTVDTRRPAYGGTCYSQFTIGETVNVTVYDSSSLTGTAEWFATSSADQAYGHVIDGIGVRSVDSGNNSLSGGAIAGIVVGSLAGFALILALLLLLLKRHRRRKRAAAPAAAATLPPEVDGVDAAVLEKGVDGMAAEVDGTGRAIAEKDAGRDGAAELEGVAHDGAHELESPLFELDGETSRQELEDTAGVKK